MGLPALGSPAQTEPRRLAAGAVASMGLFYFPLGCSTQLVLGDTGCGTDRRLGVCHAGLRSVDKRPVQ